MYIHQSWDILLFVIFFVVWVKTTNAFKDNEEYSWTSEKVERNYGKYTLATTTWSKYNPLLPKYDNFEYLGPICSLKTSIIFISRAVYLLVNERQRALILTYHHWATFENRIMCLWSFNIGLELANPFISLIHSDSVSRYTKKVQRLSCSKAIGIERIQWWRTSAWVSNHDHVFVFLVVSVNISVFEFEFLSNRIQKNLIHYLQYFLTITFLNFLHYFFWIRLVNQDIVFYSTSLSKLVGFKDLDHKCDGLWQTIKDIKSRKTTSEKQSSNKHSKNVETKSSRW